MNQSVVWDLNATIRFFVAGPIFFFCIEGTAACQNVLIHRICTVAMSLAARVTFAPDYFSSRLSIKEVPFNFEMSTGMNLNSRISRSTWTFLLAFSESFGATV